MSVAIIRDNILQLFFVDLIDISMMTRIPKWKDSTILHIWQRRGRKEKKDEATGRKGRSSPSSRRSLFVDIGRKGKANEWRLVDKTAVPSLSSRRTALAKAKVEHRLLNSALQHRWPCAHTLHFLPHSKAQLALAPAHAKWANFIAWKVIVSQELTVMLKCTQWHRINEFRLHFWVTVGAFERVCFAWSSRRQVVVCQSAL